MARFFFKPFGGSSHAREWAKAIERNDRSLRTSLLARVGEGVEEVMQETALAAMTQTIGPDEVENPGAWLYRIAIRKALLYRRSHGRRRKLLDRYAGSRSEAFEAEPIDRLLLIERKGLVREALSRLLPRDSEILLLKYTEDWSYRDLATRLGISESAVEARLHRARAKLRNALAGNSAIEVLR